LQQNGLPELLKDVDPKTMIHKSILREYTISHFLLAVLCIQYISGMMDRTEWPAHSADLSQLEFYLWEHIQTTEVNDVQDNGHVTDLR